MKFNSINEEIDFIAKKVGAKYLANEVGIRREALLRYRNGKCKKIPYEIVIKIMNVYEKNKEIAETFYYRKRK